MSQKGFVNIVLIVLVVVLAGALGYVTLVKKSALKENVEYHLAIQGNPSYKTVALSDVINFSSISVNNYATTNGTIVFVEGRTDGANYPRLVLSDNSGHYIIIPVAHAFYGDFGPVFSKLKVGDVVQVWGIAERLDVVSSMYPGINFDSKTVGGLNLNGIKKL